jgi:hypothetical protein
MLIAGGPIASTPIAALLVTELPPTAIRYGFCLNAADRAFMALHVGDTAFFAIEAGDTVFWKLKTKARRC